MPRGRDLRLQTKGLVVVGIPLVAMVAVALIFSNLVDHQRRQQQLVERTLNVRRQIQLVLTLMVDAETGARGYALSRNPEFLRPLEEAQRQLPDELRLLEQAVAGEKAQTARLRRLEDLSKQRLDRIGDVVASVQNGTFDPTEVNPSPSQGKSLMDEIRTMFARMQEEEVRLQGVQLQALQKADRRLQIALWAGLAVGLLGGLGAEIVFVKSIVSRVRRLNENAGLLSDGKPLHGLPPGNDEIGQLGRRMEMAGELLRAREEELAKAGAELREGLSLLRATLDATTDGIAAVDGEGRLVLHNHRFLDMWDVEEPDEPEKAGRSSTVWDAMISRLAAPEATLAALQPRIESADAAGTTLVELGSGEIFEVRFHPQRLDDEVIGRVWSVHDVTETHRHQEHLERARLEAEQARGAAELAQAKAEQARVEAEQANRAKSDFLSRMSHELRTPLNAILGFGQLLEMEAAQAPDSREAQSVRQILKAGKHLLGLINEVLDIARIESGKLALSIEEIALGEVIAEVLDLVAPMAASSGITLDGGSLYKAGWKAQADRQRLKQVLLNLVSNAVKYSRRGDSVTLSAGYAGDGKLRIAVADTGPGIAEENLGRLFAPFERIGAETTHVEGTGLGLALSKRLAQAMGGDIGVESTVDVGSTFWVDLIPTTSDPIRLDEATTEQVVRLEEGPRGFPGVALDGEGAENAGDTGDGEPAGAPGPRLKLLYIEDNTSNLRLIQQLVDRRPEVELLSSMQGGLGIELARSHYPDLVFLDLHLPDMRGVEVLEALQTDPSTSGIPVVILSADATRRQIERLYEAGAHDYVTKPLDLRRILAILDEALARQQARD